jgi:hypothetical protein
MISTLPNCYFGQSLDGTPVPAGFHGQSGWFAVPRGWSVITDSGGQIWASPNADFTRPKFACKLNESWELVYQDLMDTLIGQPTTRPPVVVQQDSFRLASRQLQLWNADARAWQYLSLAGDPPQYALDTVGGSDYRVNGNYFELLNYETRAWWALMVVGAPVPQIQLVNDSNIVMAVQPTYRYHPDGFQLQNSDTGLWHILNALGSPAQLVLADFGES